MGHRVETDSMGPIEVASDVYWGAQTQRSLQNFRIGGEKFPREFIRAYALVKQAAAYANKQLGVLDAPIADLIIAASQELIDGNLENQFPLVVWQTGSGTQTNMNLNEVISNRAIEMSHGEKGSKKPVHPNDHVNCSQSTNDTFPTAMYVAAAIAVQKTFIPAIDRLIKTFDHKSHAFKDVVKMGRTHLQDATPLTLGQEISSWSAQLLDVKSSLQAIFPQVCQLAVGGTAVGTGLNAHPDFSANVASYLAEKTKIPFVPAHNKFAALAAHDALVTLSGVLNTAACAFMKIANDVRWLASGPRGGIGEIKIAENEPGSSIMPGKVNPTQAEAATMVCCQVMGNHVTISTAASQGNFQLNVYKPVMIYAVLQSVRLLADAMTSFDENCAQSIVPNYKRLEELKTKSLMLVTALTPYIGYDNAAKAAKVAHETDRTLKEVVLEMGLMSGVEFDQRVRPEDMLGPKRAVLA